MMNPLFLRYWRSRLRPKALIAWSAMTMIVTLFVFFTSQWAGTDQLNMGMEAAARLPIIPLLMMQGGILFFLGTGSVASGMTAEEDEGVIDYQRLVPMSPLSKVIGYLLGLPVREWFLFLITLPFSIWCFWKGGIPMEVFGELYAVVVSTALLYHMTALLSATVMKNRRLAFLGSMSLIFALYTAIPTISRFGLVAFEYVTITPTLEQFFPKLVEIPGSEPVDGGMARFFGFTMPHSRFTLISQGAYLLIMGTMLWRRWRHPDCHLLGKLGGLVSFSWMQAVLLGTSIPLIARGQIFPSNNLSTFTIGEVRLPSTEWKPDVFEGEILIGIYGLLTLGLLWVWTSMIAPSPSVQRKGWQRATKLGQLRLSYGSDASGAGIPVTLMAMIGTGAWCFFSRELFRSKWFPETTISGESPFVMFMVAGLGGLLIQQLIEKKGRKAAMAFLGALMVVPFMAIIMMMVLKDQWGEMASWIMAFSPLTWSFFAAEISLVGNGVYGKALLPFWLVQGVMLFWWLRLLRKPRFKESDPPS